MLRLAILDDYQNCALALADWASVSGQVEVRTFTDHLADPDRLAVRLADFDAVFLMRERTQFRREVIERLPKLRLILTAGMNNAAIDFEAATERGIQCCGTTMLGYPTAELTWGLIIGLVRHIPAQDAALRRGRWQTQYGFALNGKTLGVVGLGKLGKQVAAVGKTFGMDVIAWSINLTAEQAAAVGVTRVEKTELFERADVVTIHYTLGTRSRGLVGAADLALMKPTAYLVNTSRGPIVDESALAETLRARRIAGAALDVYSEEPLPAQNPWVELENVIVTPHLGYVTEENFRHIYGQTLENARAFANGSVVRPINTLVPA